MLRLENICKSFIQRGVVLDNLSLEVNEGESISITGPSGSGKTTLLNIIGTLDRPDSGGIYFRNKNIEDLDDDGSAYYRNRNIGFVFQDHLLLPYLTIWENIILPLAAFRIEAGEYASGEEHAKSLMERTGIKDLSGKYPFQISGGEAQRATLVRSLVNKPDLLLGDEPTGSLDSENAELLGNLLSDLNKDLGITLIVATHSPDLAGKMKKHFRLTGGKLQP
ncbi:MAG TPA: ABC transporter ATP-binding protein [Bacteroidales bacterium]|nr:ABC transporter ATP-binding protein [Bacteroidales bacterium]HPF03558.1 ABC transporter ATP-binding protein [Bacteroidales bacterium]HPJ60471.1 ABC transporter ATP-binding protein [Bacteroidales bacterium]HPR11176.1 ABC transporter ATP-binding protein [Bacteroidales bacterium]HRW86212.1 ABC transporter ATP-binding protein [Bacteroidales bacterium]